ncbi:cation:proton antiporter [Psychrobacter sp. I-STPA6b]|uniref:cation:proton antiporter n=1 Tax=Psychrobacter sp. I-STPA6b TaxID=2585718 RepID=UPI001D0C7E59|nr:cation:proton antiporter [Psychrobacter sp. I-STPA6b]
MIENYNTFLLLCGIACLFGAFYPLFFRKLPISLPMLLVLFGITMGYFWTTLPALNPLEHGILIEKVCEMVVLISLVGAGIKLDTPLQWQYWRSTARLLLITMPICIIVIAMLGYYTLSLSLGAAILLGAVLAPTDPVLAASIQVGPPNTGQEDTSRFTLTSEAGLNDGLAFPFVYLAIKITEALTEPSQSTEQTDWFGLFLTWLADDVLWKIGAGLGVGILVGKLVAKVIFSNKAKDTTISQGYSVIALTLLSYGMAELIHSYGFIAVFVAAFTFRRFENQHHYHEQLHDFAEQSEGLLMSLVLVTFGMAIGQAFNANIELTWTTYIIGFICLLFVRPIAGRIGLAGLDISKQDKWVISSLGIRGIGTFYYLSYALNTHAFHEKEALILWIVCAFVIFISIFLHGMSAPSLLKLTQDSQQSSS